MSDSSYVDLIRSAVSRMAADAAKPFDWPEAHFHLDLDSRRPAVDRMVRHIHQMCTLHSEHLRRASFVKLVYLGTFYLAEHRERNPLGLSGAARAVLENHAFLRHIWALLTEAMLQGSWESRGRTFFGVLVRARFGTNDARKRSALENAGVPAALTRPYKVGECIATVERLFPERFSWIGEHYARLCDFVHASLSSQTVSTAGGYVANSVSVGKGQMLLSGEATVIRHQYPSDVAHSYVLDMTAERVFLGLDDAVTTINQIPTTPYDPTELTTLTGHPLGVREPDAQERRQ